jgi:hypothetical protein
MSLFGRNEDDASYGVLIDISSGSVGIAIVESDPQKQAPAVIYAERTSMRITKHGAEETENIRRIKETLFSSSLTVSQDGMKALLEHDPHARLTKMYVTCSTPWSYTTARSIYFENDEPMKVTSDVVSDLIKSAETEILTDTVDAEHIKGDIFEIVERATIDYTINDYPIPDPIKLKGKSFGLTHVAGLIPSEIRESIEEIHEKFFPQTELKVHTYMFAMYCLLQDLFPDEPSLSVIDVTAETTELALVENTTLIENTFITSGSSSFIRDTMEKTGQPASDIQSFMSTESETTHSESSKLSANISAYANEVSIMVSKLQENRIVPTTFVITSQKPYELFFTTTIMDALTPLFSEKPRLIDLKGTMQKISSFDPEMDVYLMILAQFFHKSRKCGEPTVS